MAHYLVGEVKVTDETWIPEYAAKAHEIVHRHGGKYLTRSGAIEAMEGAAPDANIMVIIEFPSADAARAFVADADYAPLAAARQAGSVSRLVLLDESDVAGTIDYLPAAG